MTSGPKGEAADEETSGITYEGAIDQVANVPGTISVTLTPDQTAVRRIAVQNFELASFPNGVLEKQYLGSERYYLPPLPLVDGSVAFTLALPSQTVRFQPQFSIRLQVDSKTQVSGNVQLCLLYECAAESGPDFTATGPHEFPPQVPATIHAARIEDQSGTISFALDDNRTMPFFKLHDIVAPPCFTEPKSLTAVFTEPKPLEFGAAIDVVGPDGGRLTLNGQRTGDAYSGTLTVRTFDCNAELHWTTGDFPTPTASSRPATATPVSTPSPAPALPLTGSGPPPHTIPWWLAVIAVVASVFAAFGIARARRLA
jgi:hypothetical protein